MAISFVLISFQVYYRKLESKSSKPFSLFHPMYVSIYLKFTTLEMSFAHLQWIFMWPLHTRPFEKNKKLESASNHAEKVPSPRSVTVYSLFFLFFCELYFLPLFSARRDCDLCCPACVRPCIRFPLPPFIFTERTSRSSVIYCVSSLVCFNTAAFFERVQTTKGFLRFRHCHLSRRTCSYLISFIPSVRLMSVCSQSQKSTHIHFANNNTTGNYYESLSNDISMV